jgi:hypothetical protein
VRFEKVNAMEKRFEEEISKVRLQTVHEITTARIQSTLINAFELQMKTSSRERLRLQTKNEI